MLCSVIVPLYNKGPYIEAALASVLAQTHADWEVVVVDDGSSDDGAQRVRACADARVRLVSQANGGVSRARNRGIQEARGELICFLDADDWYGPVYLETMVAMARAHPSGSFFACGFERIPDSSLAALSYQGVAVRETRLLDDFFERRRRGGPFFCTNSVAIWRSDLLPLQPCFPEGESAGEDQDLWFRLAERLTLVFTPAQLVAYRVEVVGSLCAIESVDVLAPTFERLEQRALAWPAAKPARRSALRLVSDARVSVARAALARGRRGEALAGLRRAASGGMSRHWWVALALCCMLPTRLAIKWQMWRETHISS
ncbi:glycosyltransferase family 2 protein [Janthinobacterium sp. NFX145]|uniref:glycosyltransferase family 2 protein n=1 Tax=Janthinobacterium sp. NFX145 TaxID=3415602 RepID=UPI003CC59832